VRPEFNQVFFKTISGPDRNQLQVWKFQIPVAKRKLKAAQFFSTCRGRLVWNEKQVLI